MTRIFVNFRREDVPTEARRIRDGLAASFGRAGVQMDADGVPAGMRSDSDPAAALQGCDVLVAVIGPRWVEMLRAHSANASRDMAREQIAVALKRGMAVIPVRVGRDGSMPPIPRVEDLPDSIRPLALLPGHIVAAERFDTDVAGLAEDIRRLPGAAVGGVAPGNSTVKLWLWSAAAAASAALVANLSFYLSGASALLSSTPPGIQSRPTVSGLLNTAEERIRRAIVAAEARGRRGSEARRCQTALISASATGTIVFHTASAELDQRSHETLDNLGQIVKGCPDFVIEVEGHTDSAGEPAANQRLSERRANSVRDYLIKSGVSDSSLAAIGYGETRPIAPNDSPANMARNRRIEFNVTVK